MNKLESVVAQILRTRSTTAASKSVLVAISGIDGCGKGFVAGRIVDALRQRGVRVASINVDGWLDVPARRFDPSDPAEHFYAHAIRFDEMFAQLVLPLRERRSIRVVADFEEETAAAFRPHAYEFDDVDVIVLEGIFLLKRAFTHLYDLAIWIECTFETALERALARGQEHLPPAETKHAYRTIYFPAEEIHIRRDDPRGAADIIVDNDPRLDRTSLL